MIAGFIAAAPDTSGMFAGFNMAGITAIASGVAMLIIGFKALQIMGKSDKQDLGRTMTTSNNLGVGLAWLVVALIVGAPAIFAAFGALLGGVFAGEI